MTPEDSEQPRKKERSLFKKKTEKKKAQSRLINTLIPNKISEPQDRCAYVRGNRGGRKLRIVAITEKKNLSGGEFLTKAWRFGEGRGNSG